MGKYIESIQTSIMNNSQSVRVLELGSGTGLGGIHLAKLLEKSQVQAEIFMTDICLKSLSTAKKNLARNGVVGV